MTNNRINALSFTFETNDVFLSKEQLDGAETLKVIKNPIIEKEDEPTFAKLIDHAFHNGTIEVDVYSQLQDTAPDYARGFIGLTFRINKENDCFEGIYVRPTNGSAPNQLRRNRATQYFSYPHIRSTKIRSTGRI